MIRITIELLPHGDVSRKRLLGTVLVANDGKGTVQRGNYHTTFITAKGHRFKRGRIENHPRKAQSIWKLLAKVFSVFI